MSPEETAAQATPDRLSGVARTSEQIIRERLYVQRLEILVALPMGADVEELADTLNLALIPLQRRERDDKSAVIDYSLVGVPFRMEVLPAGYDYADGFNTRPRTHADRTTVTFLFEKPAPRSDNDLEIEYAATGEHPIHTRSEWRQAVSDQDTMFGYWEWLASYLEMIESEE